MTEIRTLIVEDEPPARERLRRFLGRHREIRIVGECADGRTALEQLRKQRPHLVFLDVHLPKMNAFEILKALNGDVPPAVVIVTAHDRYAVDAFDHHAVDCLRKPFTQQRLKETLRRVRSRLGRSALPVLANREPGPRQDSLHSLLSLRIARRIVVIRTDEIDFAVADRSHSTLHTPTKNYRIRVHLAALLRKLPAGRFVRANRSTVVNVDRVQEIVRKAHGDAIVRLQDGREFTLARRYRAQWLPLLAE